MKQLKFKSVLCVVMAVLLAAAVFALTGCQKVEAPAQTEAATPVLTDNLQVDESLPPEIASEISEALENVVEFTFEVTGADGVTSSQVISTDCETVGDALLAYGMIEGEEGDYGLYVKTVLGETHDYDADGTYWAFYVNGEYAVSGVDTTTIEPGAVYAFRAES